MAASTGELLRHRHQHLLLLLVLALVCYRMTAAGIAGPYWLSVRQLQNCPKAEVDVPQNDLSVDSRFRYNRTMKSQVMDINMTLSNRVFARGESKMKLDVARWDTVSGWREHFLVMPLGELCFIYEDIVSDIIDYYAHVAGIGKKCPRPDGHFVSENALVKQAAMRHFPSLPYGRYKVTAIIGFLKSSRPKDPRSCIRMEVDVIPKN